VYRKATVKLVKFNLEQKSKAKKISNKILSKKVKKRVMSFGSGIFYNNKMYWWVLASNGKSYYFRSSKNFSNIKYIKTLG